MKKSALLTGTVALLALAPLHVAHACHHHRRFDGPLPVVPVVPAAPVPYGVGPIGAAPIGPAAPVCDPNQGAPGVGPGVLAPGGGCGFGAVGAVPYGGGGYGY